MKHDYYFIWKHGTVQSPACKQATKRDKVFHCVSDGPSAPGKANVAQDSEGSAGFTRTD